MQRWTVFKHILGVVPVVTAAVVGEYANTPCGRCEFREAAWYVMNLVHHRCEVETECLAGGEKTDEDLALGAARWISSTTIAGECYYIRKSHSYKSVFWPWTVHTLQETVNR